MKIGVSLFAVAATASVLSSSAFAGSYQIAVDTSNGGKEIKNYKTVSATVP